MALTGVKGAGRPSQDHGEGERCGARRKKPALGRASSLNANSRQGSDEADFGQELEDPRDQDAATSAARKRGSRTDRRATPEIEAGHDLAHGGFALEPAERLFQNVLVGVQAQELKDLRL